ncbi:MAG TPA: LysR family transcriptional regulator [Casimicrobiaceae bacterium]|nr:LysR family transcriptional regulator [Casimicrobiaceae bacterium]
MDFNQLRSFIAVAKHGHLTRASESLHLSQPALSGQIKALEETLGVMLFRRAPSGMILTPSGQVLLEQAEQVMNAVQDFRTRADGLRGVLTGHLTLGTVLDPGTLRVGELLNRAVERYPQLEIELHHVVSHEATAGVRDGSLDASFYFGAAPDALEAVALRDITYRVAMPIAWADELGARDWDKLAQRPWIVAPESSSHRQLVVEAFRSRKSPPPEHTIEADNESVIVNLVESGVGASVVREELALAPAAEGRIVLWPDARVDTTLWLAFEGSRALDPLVSALIELVREVWSQPVALAA